MKAKVVGVWIAAILLSLMFLFFSSIKIFAWQEAIFETQMEMIISYGLNREIFAMIGVIEMFGAIAILWNRRHWIAALGAFAILFTSTGAIGVHTFFDHGQNIVPSLITFTLSLAVFLHNLPMLKERFLTKPE